MTIKEQIEKDLKSALLGGNRSKATVLRGLKGSILNAEIAKNKRDIGLSDEEVLVLLAKESKTRTESAKVYSDNGVEDRAQQELAEKSIIDAYLPEQMNDSELQKIINQAANEIGATSMSDMGKLIGAVKAKVGGQADGSRIAELVKEKLTQ